MVQVTRGSPVIPDSPYASVNRFPIRQCLLVRSCDILSFHLLSDDFDDDPFGALPIEFTVEETLPGAKVDPAIGDGQDNLVMEQEVFEVGIAVVLACLVMAIGGIYGCQLLCPFHDVALEAGFLVLDDD